MRITPWLNSISSPGRTSLLGLAGAPLTFTRPPRMASTASARVFTSRAAHSHLSMRTGWVSICSHIESNPREILHARRLADEAKYFVGVYRTTATGGRGEIALCAKLKTTSRPRRRTAARQLGGRARPQEARRARHLSQKGSDPLSDSCRERGLTLLRGFSP